MFFSKKKIGLMQGRLSPIYNGKIQSFPKYHWKQEFKKLKNLGLYFLEWTLDYKEIYKNPILTDEGIKKINNLKKNIKLKLIL